MDIKLLLVELQGQQFGLCTCETGGDQAWIG